MGEEIFIDANIFLEIFLKDDKSEACKSFLRSLKDENTSAKTSDFIIYSCLIHAQKNIKGTKSIKEILQFFNSLSNINILRPTIEEMRMAAEIMDSYKLDFDDSLVVACMKLNGIKKLASLDRHFDKVKGIQRIKF